MRFNGNLTDDNFGFYNPRSVVESPIATTKFKATFARKAFPCFDEPAFKARFTIVVVRPTEDYIALSNMPILEERADSPKAG